MARSRAPRALVTRLAVLLLLAPLLVAVGETAAQATVVSVGDASANGAGCSWTIGTSQVSKTVTFGTGGTYELTSFQNLASGRQYVQAGTVSPEFSLTWDGTSLSGATSGWACSSGTVTTPSVGGLQVVQLAVALTRSGLKVTKFYQAFPSESVIREWTTYTNTDSSTHTLGNPSFVDQQVMTSDIAAGHVQLQYMLGAACCNNFSYQQQTTTLTSSYARDFDSYDPLDCVDSGSTPSSCTPGGWRETSSSYIPWFSLWNTSTSDGMLMMFDYMGRWQVNAGNYAGGGSLTGSLPNYNASVAAGATVTSPVATVMTYTTNEDRMTNELLDYQYRYLWDDTNASYFAKIAAPADWCTGTQWCAQFDPADASWDQQGVRQKIYGLTNLEDAAGIDVDWRDNGWWDAAGSWNGPDFQLTNSTLNKLGERSIIYYPAYDANNGSSVYTGNPSWFPTGSPCGYGDHLGDLSIPAFASWMQNLLVSNAQKWGGYEFRNDSCPIADTSGDKQLAEDQAYRNVIGNFIASNPANAYFSVDSGGNEIGLDTVRLSSAVQFYDAPGIENVGGSTDQFYGASRLFPVDKISGDPNAWDANQFCTQQIWADLAMDPSYFSTAYPLQTWHADTTDTSQIECARKLSDMYHYMVAQGVAGRWTKQYHPSATDSGTNWFERTNQGGTEAVISRIGAGTGSSVTVYPSGLNLNPTANYDVEFQFTSGARTMTGAQIQAGITLPAGAVQGETIYINLPGRPGAANDATAPTAPTGVTATASTDVNYPDVLVSWTASTDNNAVSYYNVYRNNVYVGRASKTAYLDHTPDASPNAVYSVQAVDGAGNTSTSTSSSPPHPADSYAVDDSIGGLITYSGTWQHQVGVGGASDSSLSVASGSGSSATYTFTGSVVTAYFQLAPDQGNVSIAVDGVSSTLDLYAPDPLNYSMPIFTRAFAGAGAHTISITPTGTKNSKSSGTNVRLDGLNVQSSSPSLTDDAAFSYSSGWTSTCSGCDAINSTQHQSSTAGATASFTVNSSRVRLIGNYCSSCGEADVSVDGTFATRVDTYGDRGAAQTHAVLLDKSWPVAGSHVITVTVDGTKNLESSGNTVTLDAALSDNNTQSGPPSMSAYTQQVASDAPTGYWRLGDAAGSGTAADSSGHAIGGTVYGSVTFGRQSALASDPANNAASFDGSAGYIDLGNPTALQTNNATVSAWIKTTSNDSGYHAIALKWFAYGLFVHNGNLFSYDWSTETPRDTTVFVADNKWHQVALSYQSGITNGSLLYVDGHQAGPATTLTTANQANDALIGAGSTSGVELFNGTIDDVAIYPTALPATRIAAQYAAASYAKAVQFRTAAGYWRLDDASGSGTAADSTADGDIGTVHGSVAFGQAGAIVSDPTDTAANFGGTGFVDLGNPSALQGNSATVTAWIKTASTDTAYHAVAIKWLAYGLFVRNGNLLTYDWSTETPHDTGVFVANNSWHQVVLSYQSGVTNGSVLYVDGHQAGPATTLTTASQGSDALIGAGSTTGVEPFNGTIDDVAFYPTPLTSSQVSDDFNGAAL